MSGSLVPSYSDVEPPDLNLHQRGNDTGDIGGTIPRGRETKKRMRDTERTAEEPGAETCCSPKRRRLEFENPGSEGEDSSPGPLSEKAKGKRPARSPEIEEVPPKLEQEYVQESQLDESPQIQFDGRAKSPAVEPLTAYTCPICFGVVTNATMTPW